MREDPQHVMFYCLRFAIEEWRLNGALIVVIGPHNPTKEMLRMESNSKAVNVTITAMHERLCGFIVLV